MSFGKVMKSLGLKALAQAKANGQIPEGAKTITISSTGGSGRFGKLYKATGTATKMNGDTSAPAQDKGFLGGNAKKVKRNTMFGN